MCQTLYYISHHITPKLPVSHSRMYGDGKVLIENAVVCWRDLRQTPLNLLSSNTALECAVSVLNCNQLSLVVGQTVQD